MAGRISASDIAEVRERTRIEEVVGEYVALRPAGGGSLKGLCPFHDEKSPSMNVRPSHRLRSTASAAARAATPFAFVQADRAVIGFVEAVERLADRIGITG